MSETNRRLLLIDDSQAIHEDFKKILAGGDASSANLASVRAAFSGEEEPSHGSGVTFEIDSALQGEEGLQRLLQANAEGRPYALAFVDVRMPPGWDGIETIRRLWENDQDLQVVVCTAFSDYSWDETIEVLGQSDRLLILKKPFDPIEIRQLACALTEKWNAIVRERELIQNLTKAEQEQRAYASSLETVNRALETSNMAAARASEMKSDFLLHLSDEVHQRVNAVLERIECVRRHGTPSQTTLASLEEITSESRDLMKALDDIMDITLMEAGDLQVDGERCSPLAIARSVLEELRPLADASKLSMELRCAGPIPEYINSVPKRLRQILRHLVKNAIEYSPEGSVRILLDTEPTGHWQNSLLRCQVADTGAGIPPELRGRLFEPFAGKQVGESLKTGGTGLGLALSKRLARLLGGDLKVSSAPEGGTIFTVIIQTGDLSGVRMVHR